MKKWIVEYRLDNKKGNWNPFVMKEQLEWRKYSEYESYNDMVKAIKDLNKNHNGLYEFRQKINTKQL